MGQPLLLEDFTPIAPPPLARERIEGLTESQRLSAFEQGYKAGWDDAVTAGDGEKTRLTADISAQLGDISFGFHEARTHVLSGVRELITSVVGTLVPKIGASVLPVLVHDHLQALIEEVADTPVTLRVSPARREAIEAAIPADPGFPLQIEEHPDFSEGQVSFLSVHGESELNLENCFDEITQEIELFFAQNERQRAYG
ncbi:MAG: hypothetical protein AAGF94_01835 [Pseudomonadota bacterium]